MQYKNVTPHLVRMVSILLLTSIFASAGTFFQPAQTYRSGAWRAQSVAIGDMNSDGKPDLVVTNACLNTTSICKGAVGILLGNGDGTFQPVKLFDTGLPWASSVSIAEVNHDGNPDVIVSSNVYCSPCSALVSVMLGGGDGTLGPPTTYTSSGGGATKAAAADVNGDGNPDLLVAWCLDPWCASPSNGSLGVLLGNGDGTFQAAENYDTGAHGTSSLVVADLNGDGKLDVALSHDQGVGVLRGNGDGSFQTAQMYSSGGWDARSIAIADVNADGKPDLLVTNRCTEQSCIKSSAVAVLLGAGNGTFESARNYGTSGFEAVSIGVADVNGDGKLDVLVSHVCRGFCDTSLVAALLGNGDGTFKTALRYFSGGRNAYGIAVVDLNADAKPDVVVANECVTYADCTTGSVGVLLGTAGVFTTTTIGSNLNPSVFGKPVTFTATVASIGSSTPSGTIRFQNGSLGIGTVPLSGGVATLTKTNLPAGTLSITAKYSGDPDSAKSTSAPFVQGVRQAWTKTTIVSSLNPSAQGQPVIFTVRVTSPTVRVTGMVTLAFGATTLGTVPLVGEKAAITTSALPKGTNQITATYEGTTNIHGSAAYFSQTVY